MLGYFKRFARINCRSIDLTNIFLTFRRAVFSVTTQEASWVASLSMLGAWCGAMIGNWIMRRGRRVALRVTSLPLAAAWILTGVAPCVEVVYCTSFLGGLFCSVITMVAQVSNLVKSDDFTNIL